MLNISYFICTAQDSDVESIVVVLIFVWCSTIEIYENVHHTKITRYTVYCSSVLWYPHDTHTHTHTVCSRPSDCGWRSHASTHLTSISGDCPLSTTQTDSQLSSRPSVWVGGIHKLFCCSPYNIITRIFCWWEKLCEWAMQFKKMLPFAI